MSTAKHKSARGSTVKLRRGDSKPTENVVSRAYFSRSYRRLPRLAVSAKELSRLSAPAVAFQAVRGPDLGCSPHQTKSRPVLDDIQAYREAEREKVLPKSPIGQAIAYALLNWEALIRYAEGGDLEIDNNAAERSLRGVAVGRKNWMFYGSDNGRWTAAVLSSFIATSKRLHIDPFTYLRDVFERISAHPQAQLDQLLPDEWKTPLKRRS